MGNDDRAAILGVTGFVGRGLPTLLAARGLSTTGVSRLGSGALAGVKRWQSPATLDLSGHRAVINLAGESVARRWTTDALRSFRESRVGLTRRLVEAIRRLPADARPKVLVNASAVGYYGNGGESDLTEMAPAGKGFLADLCRDWEAAAAEAEALGVRVVRLRLGIVLGQGGMAFERMRRVFQCGFGGRLGNGRQWMSWIHLHDIRAAIVHAVVSESLQGAVNGTAPEPVRNAEFTAKLAEALNRPAVLPVPGFALKIALGEFGATLLDSQRVQPGALLADGFQFKYPDLTSALDNLVGPFTPHRSPGIRH